jgi:hypothetical protein
MAVAAFYRFWPGAAANVRDTLAAEGTTLLPPRVRYPSWLEGSFDLALELDAGAIDEDVASLALDAAWALVSASTVPAREPAVGTGAFPAGLPVQILRAMDGWDAVAFPSREAWLTFAMAFLRRRVFQRVPHDAAWHSEAANELATLTLDTHRAEDVEGTARTYNVPCAAIEAWLDDTQAVQLALKPFRTPAARLADALWYAAVVPLDGPSTDSIAFCAALRRVFAAAGAAVFAPEVTEAVR